MERDSSLRLRRVLKSLGVGAASLVLILVAFELLCRLFIPPTLFPPIFATGWRGIPVNRPDVNGRMVAPDYNVRVVINKQGLRDRFHPYEKDEQVYRILCLGDSFTFGVGVEADESYPKVVERCLRDRLGRSIQVINSGVGSWGTSHELVYWEEEGKRFRPDLVLLGFYGNDPSDNLNSGLFNIQGGKIKRGHRTDVTGKTRGVLGRIPGYAFLAQHSHAFNFIRIRASRIAVGIEQRRNRGEDSTQDDPIKSNDAWKLTTSLIRELNQSCLRRRAILAVIYICDRQDLESSSGAISSIDQHARMGIRAVCARMRIPFFDVTDALSKNRPTSALYFPHDIHWTPKAQKIAGEAIAQWIANSSFAFSR